MRSWLTKLNAKTPNLAAGPLLALLSVAVLWISYATPMQKFTPFPVSLLTVVVIYSIFRSGRVSGMISAVITIVYLDQFLKFSGAYQHDAADALNRLMSWTLAMPIIVGIVGALKKSSLQVARHLERNRSLHEITEVMPQIVWTGKADGTIDFFNQHWFEYTGLDAHDPVTWETVIHSEDVAKTLATWRLCVNTGTPYELEARFRRADGAYRWHLCRAQALRSDRGEILRWVGTTTDIHTQKEMESQAQASMLRTKVILEHVSAIVWAIDQNGIFTFSDGIGLKLVGLKGDERVGKSLFSIYSEDHEIAVSARKALRGETCKCVSLLQTVWFEISFSPILAIDGTITGVAGIAIDVTSRVESESAKIQLQAMQRAASLIRESEEKFKGAFQNSPIGIGLATLDGKWFDVNPAFCRMLGYSRAELITLTISDITYADDEAIGADFRTQMLTSEVEHVSFEKRYLHKKGYPISFWISGSIVRDASGDPQYILGQMVDVTETRRAEQELKETTWRLQSLINSSPVGILTLNEENKVTVWNPALEKMFGWSADEALGKALLFVSHDMREESAEIIQKIVQTREPVVFETDRMKKDGSLIKCLTSAIPLMNHDGKITGLMAVISDATERYRSQKAIIDSNRALQAATQAKSDFLANMSHEIRTPINGVIGMTGLLLDLELGAEQRSYAETIRSSAEILLTLVSDILDFSKIEAGKVDLELIDFDLGHVVQNMERLMSANAKTKQLKLLRSVAPELLHTRLIGDPTRISQVLANLLSNAIKFTEKGQVIIEISQDAGNITPADDTVNVRVEITDTGIGMSREALARMFQPFSQADASTTRRFGGTGLGLSICKHLIETMGGEIGVRSTQGLGSTFWFTLKLKRGAPARFGENDKIHAIVRPSSDKPLRILLAEDNKVNQLIAIKTLEKNGFRVEAVANGKEALHALEHAPYDLVLMDCQMPELDGYEATKQIRKHRDEKIAKIPVIAMTANAVTGDREKCLAAGMNDYVTKPIKPADLVRVIYQTLGLSSVA